MADTVKEIISYIRASYPLLWIVTPEEARAENTIIEAVTKLNKDGKQQRKLRFWSCTEGFFSPTPENEERDPEAVDAIKALETMNPRIPDAPIEPTVYVMRDFHAFMSDYHVARLLRDIARQFKQIRKTVIFISPLSKIPPDLQRDITLIEYELPTEKEIALTWDNLFKANKLRIEKKSGKINEDERDKIIQSAKGLSQTEAEGAFAKAIVEKVGNGHPSTDSISKIVMREKAAAVRKTGIMDYKESKETIDDIGGLENLKNWFGQRKKAFTKKAREFGLPMPRGILLAGLPGCGKSLTAKAAANILGVPLIRFDVGRVFGGLVGESEQNMRTAIQTVEAVGNCVLWIDEMEKAFAGMSSSHDGDSGVSKRVFGNFITWMQEKKCPAFIVATVNRIQGLPPEMLRKGRFDEIFFVGLPSVEERRVILEIHIKKYGRDIKKVGNLKECVKASEFFSGAEIEEAVVSSLYSAFSEDRDIVAADIVKSLNNTNPLSKARGEELGKMAAWAAENAVNASKIPEGDDHEGKTTGGRQLDLG